MPYCFWMLVTFAVCMASAATMVWAAVAASRPPRVRWVVGLVGLAAMAGILLTWLPLFRLKRATTPPTPAAMAGRYVGSGHGISGAVLVLKVDGTFTLTGIAQLPSSGRWKAEQISPNGSWTLALEDKSCSHSGFPIYNDSAPYEFELFISDPDEGGVVFEKAPGP